MRAGFHCVTRAAPGEGTLRRPSGGGPAGRVVTRRAGPCTLAGAIPSEARSHVPALVRTKPAPRSLARTEAEACERQASLPLSRVT